MALIGAIFYGEQVALIEFQRGGGRRNVYIHAFSLIPGESPTHFFG